MNTSKAIANFFIKKSIGEERDDLTQLKLMKLVYIAYGWHLALYDVRLFNENIEAWKFGPVINSLYQEFKSYGLHNITKPAISIKDHQFNVPEINTKEYKILNFLNDIWKNYKDYSGIQLANWTHLPESPWYQAWHDQKGHSIRNHPINDTLIKNYFLSLAKEAASA